MNPITMSRAELVRVLFAPAKGRTEPQSPHVGDAQATYPVDLERAALLEYKLQAAREILLRNLRKDMSKTPVFACPQALHEWLRLYCAHLEHEVFIVLYLSVQNQMIDVEDVFRGTLTQTSVYPREIVRGALKRNAAAIVMAHNHPSGSAQPSRADEALTQTLKSALALVDVRVLDHFIVAGEQTLSFAERGLI